MQRELLWQSFEKGVVTDVTLEVNGNDFNCHRSILAASPGFFGVLFNANMKECNEKKIKLGMKISKESFLDVLHYIYTGKTRKVPNSRLVEILNCAIFFQLPELENAIASDLVGVTSGEDIIDLFKTLTQYHLIKLPVNFVAICASKYYLLQDFQETLALPFSSIYSILSHSNLKITDEASLFNFIVNYSGVHSNLSRIQKLELGKLIKFSFVPPGLTNIPNIYDFVTRDQLEKAHNTFNKYFFDSPKNIYFTLDLLASDEDTLLKYRKRYTKAESYLFTIKDISSNKELKKYNLSCPDFPEKGIYDGRKPMVFNLSFDKGYTGTIYKLDFKCEKMENCRQIITTYFNSPKKKTKDSISTPLPQTVSTYNIPINLYIKKPIHSINITFVGSGKAKGQISVQIFGCMNKQE